MKAAMSMRTPCLAICGSDTHCKKLEMMLTEYIYEEQQRDGSTYYVPEMKIKTSGEKKDDDDEAKSVPKPKQPKKAASKKRAKEEDDEGDENVEKPKAKKGKKRADTTKAKKNHDDGEDDGSDGSGSSMAW